MRPKPAPAPSVQFRGLLLALVTVLMHLTIGSRGSKLALWQAEWAAGRLRAAGADVDIKVIATAGDRRPESALAHTGAKGVFIKEIEEALIAGEIDLAVHSLKDLPVGQPEELYVAAVPPREDPRDALILSARGRLAGFSDLPHGARLGTSSPRRRSQLLNLRPDLQITAVRGNVDTRLRKLDGGGYDGLVVAAAGMHRLGFRDRIAEYFPFDQICPAPGQGAMAIEIRRDDAAVAAAVLPLDDHSTHLAIRAERACLQRLGGGCQVPIGACATLSDRCLELTAVVASPDGASIIRASLPGAADEPGALGIRLAEDLLARGARELLQ